MIPGFDPAADEARPAFSPAARVWLLSTFLALVAGLMVATGATGLGPLRHAPWWMIVVIVVGYALAERFAFHIEYRREAIGFSLSELPTVYALIFLGPVPAIAVRIIGGFSVLATRRRAESYKLGFNLGLFAFETATAFAIVGVVVGATGSSDGMLLLAVTVALSLTSVASALVVPIAISAFEGHYLDLIGPSLRTTMIVAPISSLVAAVAVTPALLEPAYAPLCLVPVGAVWIVLRSHGRLTEQHRNLNAVHDFTRRVGETIVLADVVPLALDEAMQLFRATKGALHVSPVVTISGATSLTCIAAPGQPIHFIELSDGSADRVDDALLDALGLPDTPATRRGPRDRLVVPLDDGQGRIGVMILAERDGVEETFTDDDLAGLQRLSEQLTRHLRNVVMHARAERDALRDGLTGHYNRIAFDRHVADAVTRRRPGATEAVMILDLDRFKEVNDTLGHGAGDVVLIEFAQRLRRILGTDDVLARFGGDEFAIFARRDDLSELVDLARDAVEESRLPFVLDGFNVVVTASVGVATLTHDDVKADDVVRRADIAMYVAKRQHAGYEVYSSDIDRRTPDRLSLLGDLRSALDNHVIEVHYQPKLDLATSTIIGVEALARWRHPVRGWIPPDDFIRVAEETGLIKHVTDQVLATAARDARVWKTAGFDLDVAVNLSTLDLLDEQLAERVRSVLADNEIAPERLILEITESSLMADTPRTMVTIDRLNALGVRLSLDDFGTGYSSLSYLRRLPVAELKIDRSFVSNLILDEQDEAIVSSTITLGHSLGLHIVAEGVESTETMNRLRALHCDIVQGFGISRPLSAVMFTNWMASTEHQIRRRSRRGLSIA